MEAPEAKVHSPLNLAFPKLPFHDVQQGTRRRGENPTTLDKVEKFNYWTCCWNYFFQKGLMKSKAASGYLSSFWATEKSEIFTGWDIRSVARFCWMLEGCPHWRETVFEATLYKARLKLLVIDSSERCLLSTIWPNSLKCYINPQGNSLNVNGLCG